MSEARPKITSLSSFNLWFLLCVGVPMLVGLVSLKVHFDKAVLRATLAQAAVERALLTPDGTALPD